MRLISKLRRLKFYYGPNKIGYIGSNVKFPRDMIIAGGQNVEIHSSTSLGKGAVLFAKNAKICIGHNVIASHSLKIITGDHERRIGVFCNEITECMKNHEIGLDQDVIIEPDGVDRYECRYFKRNNNRSWFNYICRCNCHKIDTSLLYCRRCPCKSYKDVLDCRPNY